jgi:hypothetical protein
MAVPKTAALPLGYAPMVGVYIIGEGLPGNPVLRESFLERYLPGDANLPLRPLATAAIRPAFPMKYRCRSVAQSGSAPRSGRGGRRFESYHSDHFLAKIKDL